MAANNLLKSVENWLGEQKLMCKSQCNAYISEKTPNKAIGVFKCAKLSIKANAGAKAASPFKKNYNRFKTTHAQKISMDFQSLFTEKYSNTINAIKECKRDVLSVPFVPDSWETSLFSQAQMGYEVRSAYIMLYMYSKGITHDIVLDLSEEGRETRIRLTKEFDNIFASGNRNAIAAALGDMSLAVYEMRKPESMDYIELFHNVSETVLKRYMLEGFKVGSKSWNKIKEPNVRSADKESMTSKISHSIGQFDYGSVSRANMLTVKAYRDVGKKTKQIMHPNFITKRKSVKELMRMEEIVQSYSCSVSVST